MRALTMHALRLGRVQKLESLLAKAPMMQDPRELALPLLALQEALLVQDRMVGLLLVQVLQLQARVVEPLQALAQLVRAQLMQILQVGLMQEGQQALSLSLTFCLSF